MKFNDLNTFWFIDPVTAPSQNYIQWKKDQSTLHDDERGISRNVAKRKYT